VRAQSWELARLKGGVFELTATKWGAVSQTEKWAPPQKAVPEDNSP